MGRHHMTDCWGLVLETIRYLEDPYNEERSTPALTNANEHSGTDYAFMPRD